MTELDEFHDALSDIDLNMRRRMTHNVLWDVWKSARVSRWQSMESAPEDEDIYVRFEDGGRAIAWVSSSSGKWTSSYVHVPTPIAWHPLPDPPTKEELEKLR